MSRPAPAALRRAVRARFEPARPPADGPGAVGVELELIPGAGGAPTADDEALRRLVDGRGPPGRFTFEPGGQLEYSTPALPSLARLAADLGSVLDPVIDEAARGGIDLSAVGLASRFGPDEVGLRRPTPRYVVMDRKSVV